MRKSFSFTFLFFPSMFPLKILRNQPEKKIKWNEFEET